MDDTLLIFESIFAVVCFLAGIAVKVVALYLLWNIYKALYLICKKMDDILKEKK